MSTLSKFLHEAIQSAKSNTGKKLTDAFEKVLGSGERLAQHTAERINNSPQLEEKVRNLLSYKLMDPANRPRHMAIGALAGAGTGAATGAAVSDDSKLEGGTIGALLGAAAGAAGGRYAPRATQYGIGRVMTNLVDPHIYDGGMHFASLKDLIKEHGAKGIVKSVLKDQPLHPIEPARHALFRDFFGMKRFPGTENVLRDVGHTGAGKASVFNEATAEGRKNLEGVDEARKKSLFFDPGNPKHHMQLGKTTLLREGAMANFNVDPSGRWSDTWDFALNPGEKINSLERLLRAAITPFGTPTTLSGKTLSQADVLRAAAHSRADFNALHHSFTDPVVNRGIRGANVSAKDFMDHVRYGMKNGDPTFLNTVADNAERKPFNILRAFAKKENVSPSDMRVLLGGEKKYTPPTDRTPKFELGDLSAMFNKRIAGSNPVEVENALKALSPKDMKALRQHLTDWSKSGQPAGGELDALANTIGFSREDLPILLQ